jgi:Ribonuclease G/E
MYGHENLELEEPITKLNRLKEDILKLENDKLNIINNNNILEQKQKDLNNNIEYLNKEEEKINNNIFSLNKTIELIKEKFKILSVDLFNLNNTFLSMQNNLNFI